MADELPSIHIDTDWKKQAQEEKRKLAEQAAAAKPATPPAPAGVRVASPGTAASATGRRARSQVPPPGFASLVQSVMTQILYYLGEIASAGGQPTVDLDMARYQLDTLSMLEDKTKNNLNADEKALLDAALYETRARFVNVATQFLGP